MSQDLFAQAREALPVGAALPALARALATEGAAVLVAAPGSGKTTLVPPALLGAPWAEGRIVLTAPRRVAVRAAARRIAELLGCPVGGLVGYRTRIDSKVSAATRLEVLTTGLLLRRLQDDPGLVGTACVLLDEAHERSLDADLLLAFLVEARAVLRPDLRLVVMSATIDASGFARLLGDAPVLEAPGRLFPVTVSHAARDLGSVRDLPEAMARAVRAALAARDGDVLAFLPGLGAIRATEALLAGVGAQVHALHGDLSPDLQDRALRPGQGRKVILASPIAETSLTVEGVTTVVDGGFRRAPVRDPATGLPRLATLRISRASAEQRAGRAGRLGPGHAERLWTQALHRGLAPGDPPEILQADLAGFVLEALVWGTDPRALPLLDPPPEGAVAAARALLSSLGALDAAGRPTEAGRRMARLGAHPRIARLLLEGEATGAVREAAGIAAVLEEGDPLARGEGGPPQADLGLRLGALRGPVAEAARRYASRLAGGSGGISLGRLVASGFPDRIAALDPAEPGRFRLAGGGAARLPPTDPLAREALLAVAAADPGGLGGPRILLAARLDRAELAQVAGGRLTRGVETRFDPRTRRVTSRLVERLDQILLSETQSAIADPEAAAWALAEAAAERGFVDLGWSEGTIQFRARVAAMRILEPDAWPDLSDASLAATAPAWLAPLLAGATSLAELGWIDPGPGLRAQLAPGGERVLDRALPPSVELPKGGRVRIDYTQSPPRLEARAQALYGLKAAPSLAGGRIRLAVALLSPAGRPIAVTGDLAGFWEGAWAEVRREMRGRYPKHDWPERPGG